MSPTLPVESLTQTFSRRRRLARKTFCQVKQILSPFLSTLGQKLLPCQQRYKETVKVSTGRKPVQVHLLRERLPPDSPEPSLISLMFKLPGNTCHIFLLPLYHLLISKFLTFTSHSMCPVSKNPFWLQVLKQKKIRGVTGPGRLAWLLRVSNRKGIASPGGQGLPSPPF